MKQTVADVQIRYKALATESSIKKYGEIAGKHVLSQLGV